MKINVKLRRQRIDGSGGIEVHDAKANTVVDGQTITAAAAAAASAAADAQATADAAEDDAAAAQSTADAAATAAAAAQADAADALAALDTDTARAVEVVQGSDGKLIKVVKHGTATTPTAFPTILKTVNGSVVVTLDSTGITLANATKSLTLASAALTQDITLREIDVCDSGTPKKMLIAGSAPYT